MGTGVLLELSEPVRGRSESFARWQDEEHIPGQLIRSGASTATRFEAVEGVPPSLVVYELDRPEASAMTGSAMTGLAPGLPWSPVATPALIDATATYDCRRYVTVQDRRSDADDPGSTGALLSVGVTVRAGHEQDFETWYEEEHIPALLAIDGWLRCRRLHRLSGVGPNHLALHELRGLEVFDDPAFQQARATPWRDRAMANRIHYERRIHTLERRFG